MEKIIRATQCRRLFDLLQMTFQELQHLTFAAGLQSIGMSGMNEPNEAFSMSANRQHISHVVRYVVDSWVVCGYGEYLNWISARLNSFHLFPITGRKV